MLKGYKQVLLAKEETYRQFPNSFFRLPLFRYPSGLIIVDRAHLNEFYNAPKETLNFVEATLVSRDFRYILGSNTSERYHIAVVRGQFTQNLSALSGPVVDELNAALVDELDPLLKDGIRLIVFLTVDWTPIRVYKLSLALVSRSTYRAFVGFPLCITPFYVITKGRNPEFLQAAITHATEANWVSQAITYYPRIFRR